MILKIILVMLVMLYLFIGTIVDSIFKEEWESPSIITMLFWPILLMGLVLFGVMSLAITIGEKIKEMIESED